MKKTPEGLTKNIASSRNWFQGKLLPDGVELRHQVFQKAAEVQCYDGIKLLFVKQGSGALLVNGRPYPLQEGSCALLYCFHFHKVIPAPDDPLHIAACHISYNTFLFATIVPGYHLMEIEQSNTPILVDFTERQQVRIRQILSAMDGARSGAENDMQYALLYEWLGRICRTFTKQDSMLETGLQP